jgi:hypothetical protein
VIASVGVGAAKRLPQFGQNRCLNEIPFPYSLKESLPPAGIRLRSLVPAGIRLRSLGPAGIRLRSLVPAGIHWLPLVPAGFHNSPSYSLHPNP